MNNERLWVFRDQTGNGDNVWCDEHERLVDPFEVARKQPATDDDGDCFACIWF